MHPAVKVCREHTDEAVLILDVSCVDQANMYSVHSVREQNPTEINLLSSFNLFSKFLGTCIRCSIVLQCAEE